MRLVSRFSAQSGDTNGSYTRFLLPMSCIVAHVSIAFFPRIRSSLAKDELMACKQHNLRTLGQCCNPHKNAGGGGCFFMCARKSDRTSKHDRSPDMIKQQARVCVSVRKNEG